MLVWYEVHDGTEVRETFDDDYERAIVRANGIAVAEGKDVTVERCQSETIYTANKKGEST